MNSVRTQRYIALLSVLLFAGKIIAWYLTNSVTVLTDALEGTVNMATGFLGLYSIILASLPRDTNHPYGHGKAEFLSAAVEGTLIIVAGVVIIYEGIGRLFAPHQLEKLNVGIWIVAAAGAINFVAGRYAEKKGNKNNSLILISAGKHLQTDAYSAVAVLAGLIVIMLTENKWPWLDSAIALAFAVNIMITGYKVLRRSLSGIMDEMDIRLLREVTTLLQQKRSPVWVDLHNLRVIHYGNIMHVDAHMTLPWYYTVAQADDEIHAVEKLISEHFKTSVEVFIHIDGCNPFQCKLCALENCPERKEPFRQQVTWTPQNVWANQKHGEASAPRPTE